MVSLDSHLQMYLQFVLQQQTFHLAAVRPRLHCVSEKTQKCSGSAGCPGWVEDTAAGNNRHGH